MRTPASGPAAEEAGAGSLLLDPGIADQLAPQVALLAHEAGEVLRRARERVEAQRGQALAGLGLGDDLVDRRVEPGDDLGGSPAGPK